jgi:hypothetical protein
MTNQNKQQTAVEWLVEQFENHRATFFKLNDKEERVITLAGRDVVEQAKEMEKDQKYKFADEYCEAVMSGCNLRPEQYDNETYGGKNENN